MTEPYTGEIQIFAFPYAPNSWSFANGASLNIRQFSALYSVYGIQFGGDGVNNFNLPNLRDRFACGSGQSPGNSVRSIGDLLGTPTVSLTAVELPPHGHALNDYQPDRVGARTPGPSAGSGLGYGDGLLAFADQANTTLSPVALAESGGGAAHENRQPFLTLSYCVALNGIYPAFG